MTNENIMKNLIYSLILIFAFGNGLYSQEYVAVAKQVGNNLLGYINIKGEFILPPAYKYAYGFDESGLAPIYNSLLDEVYYINLSGDTILRSNAQYELLKPDDGLMSIIQISEGTLVVKLHNKFGIIDVFNKEIIVGIKYDEIVSFSEGYTTGKIEDKYYLLNTDNQDVLIDYPDIKKIGVFNCGRAAFELNNGKKGFIGTDGTIAIEPLFSDAYSFSNSYASVMDSSGMYGVIDTSGNWIIKPSFRRIYPFQEYENYTVAIDKYKRNVILSIGGDVKIFDRNEYSYIRPFSEGLACVTVNQISNVIKRKDKKEEYRRTGYINALGTLIIPPEFDYGYDFYNGFAIVGVGSTLGVIDINGLWVVKPQFTQLSRFTKIKSIYSDSTKKEEPEINYYDILSFLSIIANLDYVNISEVNDNGWNDFFRQDLKFINWLLSFRLDVNNTGLSQKANNAFIGEKQKMNDSETAKMLILAFLYETQDFKSSCGYDVIKAFVEENGHLEIHVLRQLWKSKMH